VSDVASVRAGIKALTASASPFDILIDNAGIARLGSSLEISDQD
jgi:NADP-dependent 3-hydroxy acid dehydrogenase YdfG